MAHGTEAIEIIRGNVFKEVVSSPRDSKLYLVRMTGTIYKGAAMAAHGTDMTATSSNLQPYSIQL